MAYALSIDGQGWCSGAKRVDSPNCDARPTGVAVELLVVHSISLPPGDFQGTAVLELFTNRLDWDQHPCFEQIRGLRVSCHFFIRRDGSLFQFVSCDQRAWHAGRSSFEGRAGCNDFSIGIELEGLDSMTFAEAQYGTLLELGCALTQRYPLVAAAAHSEIAPGRKTDPGDGFAWDRFLGAGLVSLRRMEVLAGGGR